MVTTPASVLSKGGSFPIWWAVLLIIVGFFALALPFEALMSGKVCTLPSTSRVSLPERITEVATRTWVVVPLGSQT